MNEPSNDNCITVRVIDACHGRLDGITSVFIKREGRDPTLRELNHEADTARTAERREHDMMERRLFVETGIQPTLVDVRNALYSQLDNPEYHSEFAPYRRWDQDPVFPTNSRVLTSRSNPVDLTGSGQPATNASTEKQRIDLRQTNAESVRFSPSISTRTSSLSINTLAKQSSVSERAQSHPNEFLPEADQQSDLTTQMSEPGRSKIKAVAKKPTVPASNIRDVRSKPMLAAAAKTTINASPQALRKQPAGRLFDELTNNSDAERALQSKSSPPPAKLRKVFDRSLSTRGSPQSVPTTDKRQISAQPSFVKRHKNAALLFDNMPRSTQPLLSGGSTIIGKPVFKRVEPQPSPAPEKESAQQPERQTAKKLDADPVTQQTLSNGTPKVSSTQLSENFDKHIKEMFGDLDERTHRLFKLSMLHASLYTLDNTPGSDHLAQPLYSQITANERNARTVNKSLEEVVDACDNKYDTSKTKTTDHCKILDKQEKERQESLESMAENVKNDKMDKMKLRSEIEGLKSKLMKEKEEIDKEDTERLRKYVQRKQEQNKHDGGDAVSMEEGKKRKRDNEKEDHTDVDMLL